MGMIPRKQVIKEYETASLLLLPINKADNAAGRIPGKLFEMLRSSKPIIVLGPDNGDVKTIVENEHRGRSFKYEDQFALHSFLKEAILKKNYDNYMPTNDIGKYSNKILTSKIAEYLNNII